MMAGIDQQSYFSGMRKSFEDKSRLIDFANKGTVLEIGFWRRRFIIFISR